MKTTLFFTKSKKNTFTINLVISLIIFILVGILLLHPKHYADSFLDGLKLFASSVLPGLFPFMFLTQILSSLGVIEVISKRFAPLMRKLFNSPGIGAYTFLIATISGSPVGAKVIGDLHTHGKINTYEAQNMLSYSMCSGPIFIIGTIGTMLLGSATAGIVIMASHVIANILTGLIITNTLKKKMGKISESNSTIISKNEKSSFDKILSDSMFSSVQSILVVGGFIAFFYCFSDMLFDLKIFEILGFPILKLFEFLGLDSQIFRGVMSGIVEVTRGAKELSLYFNSSPVLITSLTSMVVGFTGLSVIVQSKAMISAIDIKTRFLIFSKSVHAILSFIVCFVISSLVI